MTRVGLERECASLGVQFNLWKGESDAEPFIPELVADLKSRDIAVLDDGAWIVRVARETDKKEMPPIILVNRDGAIGYHGSDLGTIVDRKRSIDPQLSLYIVDQRQALHFEQVFRASDLAGYMPESSLEHLGFGTMNGADGKPFKTREGGVLKLHDLISQAISGAGKRMEESRIDGDLRRPSATDIAQKVWCRRDQVRGPLQRADDELHLRSRPVHFVRRQDRAVSAVRGSADEVAGEAAPKRKA